MRELRIVCKANGLDAAAISQSLSLLTGDDDWQDYRIWVGPAWADDNLLLDIYLLGDDCLYNYFERSDDVSHASVGFLDRLDDIVLAKVNDERSPYVIAMRASGEDRARIYGNAEDRDKMMEFLRKIVEQRSKSKRGK